MRVIIAEKLYVEDATQECFEWCRQNLVLYNPDYYQKQKMGKWTGNTPKEISLYEKMGGHVWLPFGCYAEFFKAFPNTPYKAVFAPVRHFDYKSSINLYDYQEKAVQSILERKNGVLVAGCGSGKTQMGLEIIARIGGRALWLTHTQDLLNQSMNRAKSVFGASLDSYGTITEGKVNVGEGLTFATIQTLSNIDLTNYKDYWDVVVVDECFPGDTKIFTKDGQKELHSLLIDDIVLSYNGERQKFEYKKVKHLFKLPVHDLVKIKLSNGKKIVATKNHPFFTKNGEWVSAEKLGGNDYVMQLVQTGDRLDKTIKNKLLSKPKKRMGILLQGVCNKWKNRKRRLDGGTQEEVCGSNESHEYKISSSNCRENDKQQSNEISRNEEAYITEIEGNGASPSNQMRKRNGLNSSTTDPDDCTCRVCGSVCRISDTDKNEKRFRLSDLLQSRYCNSRKDVGNRSGRGFSHGNRATRTRQEEGQFFEWVRVESVEVQKQTSDGTFGGLCSDGFVYNIEVEDNNNYFANDILVHNCHRAAGSPTKVTQFYKALSKLRARHKIGLTATPKRADGLERSMFALLGDKVIEIDRSEIADTTCEIRVKTINTGYMPNFDFVLTADGTIDYSKLVEDMIQDKDRFDLVQKVVNSIDGPAIVLANRVEYLKRLTDACKLRAICLSALGQSKAAKEERKSALEKLNNGELDVVFCTYQLAAEGLDVPNLRYVIFSTPEKDEKTVIQAVGRVGRKADGKEYGTVVDFLDSFGMYRGWERKRRGYYKKIQEDISIEEVL